LALPHFPASLRVSLEESVLAAHGQDAISHLLPKAVARPKTALELAELVRFCAEEGIPLTPCAGQTSLTSSSLTGEGVLVSMRAMPGDFHMVADPHDPRRTLVEAGPAIPLGWLQEQLEARGYFYPPDPTSRQEALLGATIATNASGEDSFKYGATRAWVRGLEIVHADGRLVRYFRQGNEQGSRVKNSAGYPCRDQEIDLFIGSEGTLGFITRAWLQVLPGVPEHFALLLFFPEEESALRMVQRLVGGAFDLRCLEYLDAGALTLLRDRGVGFACPDDARACLYLKQEYGAEGPDEQLGLWSERLEDLYAVLNLGRWAGETQFFHQTDSLRRLRRLRHTVPATLNERASLYRNQGGGKVGTDWYVPLNSLVEMFARVRADQREMDWVVFGHIGNGHPHFNFLARNSVEYGEARNLLERHCALAVSLGGGVAGEHGLGKLKAHLLELQYPPGEIAAMLAVKQRLDPQGLLSPGNIFSSSLRGRPWP
jgi:FAD/FMN-containing dehydrogenase